MLRGAHFGQIGGIDLRTITKGGPIGEDVGSFLIDGCGPRRFPRVSVEIFYVPACVCSAFLFSLAKNKKSGVVLHQQNPLKTDLFHTNSRN